MKILVVHQYYLMPGRPGGSRYNELARLWAKAGHDVTVISGTVDYLSGEEPQKYQGGLLTREEDGAVHVWRCRVPTTYNRGYAGRAWAFFGFTFSASLAALRERDADVVIATSPPLITPLPGWISARMRLRPARLIFEIRDLWPESAITTGVLGEKSALARLLYSLERWACASADAINVLTPAFKEDLVKRGLAVPGKISFVPNGADVESFQPGPRDNAIRREMGWGDRFVVMYAGAHGRANALGQLVDAAELLKARPDILLALVGDGTERLKLEEAVKVRGLTNVMVCGPQAKDRMPLFVQACDAGAAVLQNNPTFRTVYPNKVFDYMACARPTVLAIDGVARKLVCDDAQAGLFATPEDPRALAEAITQLADDRALCQRLGKNGLEWVNANATRQALADQYLAVMGSTERFGHPQRGWRMAVKTALDRSAGLVGMALSLPVLGVVAAGIRATLGSPVIFSQQRPGRAGKPFRIFKLRTMRDATDESGRPLPDAQRLTRLGNLLRSFSLDELPQLLNVVRGELSLVGPRPLLMRYLARYSPEQARRHEVQPGITGWAQVSGRNSISWDEKFRHDVWYVDHWSLALDAKILLRTLLNVALRSGVSSEGHATMPEFMGFQDSPDSSAAFR